MPEGKEVVPSLARRLGGRGKHELVPWHLVPNVKDDLSYCSVRRRGAEEARARRIVRAVMAGAAGGAPEVLLLQGYMGRRKSASRISPRPEGVTARIPEMGSTYLGSNMRRSN